MSTMKQTGFAMVIVIWVLSLLAIMAGSFSLTMRRETIVISAVKDNAVRMALAEAGVAIAQKMLLLEMADEQWRADGSLYQIQYQDAEIRVRLFSETGKIDINKASESVLMALIGSVVVDLEKQQELVSAIMDWRDQDDLIRINGAEKKEYEEAELTYHPANKDFQIIAELQMVLGMTSIIYKRLEPLITVYSGRAKVDLKVAPKEVLEVVATLDSLVVEDYLQQRNGQMQQTDETEGFLKKTAGNHNNSVNGVYTVVSQARYLTEAATGIVVTFKKSVDTSILSPFQVLDWQQTHQQPSLFSDEVTQLIEISTNESEHKF